MRYRNCRRRYGNSNQLGDTDRRNCNRRSYPTADALEDAYNAGYCDGVRDGREDGFCEGYELGLREGCENTKDQAINCIDRIRCR
jgi:flagellar biosynthesis/type III secretory pathway protein FliH